MKVLLVLSAILLMFATICHAAEVTLQWNWDVPADPGIDGYRIYYSIDKPGGPYDGVGIDQGDSGISRTVADLPKIPEITLTGLDPNRAYYFVVTAYANKNESEYSNEVNTAGYFDQRPLAPGNLRIINF